MRISIFFFFFFFFQAEDGIRDGRVTGVQTCALPISLLLPAPVPDGPGAGSSSGPWTANPQCAVVVIRPAGRSPAGRIGRSEERRVGKEGRSRGGADY